MEPTFEEEVEHDNKYLNVYIGDDSCNDIAITVHEF